MASTCRVISLGAQAMDCAFSPKTHTVAAGLIDGKLTVADCGENAAGQCTTLNAHHDSCRAVGFSIDGNNLLSASKDRSIFTYDLQKDKEVNRRPEAHDEAINRLLTIDTAQLATGDDQGVIKLWDNRQKKAAHSYHAHSDFISDLAQHPSEPCLVAVSGDGTLSINDIRTGKVRARSAEDADDELDAVVLVKQGRKVVCGAQSGVLSIFSWGKFEDCSDRFPGHPTSVESILKLDEDTIITGGGDGIIRVLNIQPHQLLGVLGQHDEGNSDRLALSSDQSLVASTSYQSELRVYSLDALNEGSEDSAELKEHKRQDTTVAAVEHGSDSGSDAQPRKRSKSKGQKRAGGRAMKKLKSEKPCSTAFFKDLL